MRKQCFQWIGAGLLVLALGGAGCRKAPGDDAESAKDKEPPPVLVEVAPLERGPIQEIINSTARLEAESDVRVLARTANRVIELRVEEGDHVEAGQVLLRMQDDIQRSAVEKAKARVEKSRAEFQRLEALHAQDLISEEAYTNSKFELRQLELALEDAQRELEYTQVRAPIAGTITQRLVKVGDLITVGQHLFDIVDFNSLIARVYVPDKHLPDLAPDQVARVTPTALGNRSFEGYVKRIAPVVDSRTGTVKVTVGFHDPGPLRPGMYVEVELITAVHDDALLIPKRALVFDQDQQFVYRLKDDRTVERVPVEPRLTDRFNVEPADGFAAGDQLVVAGQTGLKNGAKVRLPGDPEPGETGATNVVARANAPSDVAAAPADSAASQPPTQATE